MRIMTILRAALAAAVLAGWGAFSPPAQQTAQQSTTQGDDEWQGLPEGPGREEVFYVCQACHSLAIVQQQGLDRESWDEVLKWMVAEQEMEPLEAEPLKLVLDYLTKHYGRE